MGNNASSFNNQEKDIYLREIQRLTDQNRKLRPTVNMNNQNTPNYSDKEKLNLQNQLMMSQMQKQIVQNQSEINRLRNNNAHSYNSSYTKIANQHARQTNSQNDLNINPQVIQQILNNDNIQLSSTERQRLENYLNSQEPQQIQSQYNHPQIQYNQSQHNQSHYTQQTQQPQQPQYTQQPLQAQYTQQPQQPHYTQQPQQPQYTQQPLQPQYTQQPLQQQYNQSFQQTNKYVEVPNKQYENQQQRFNNLQGFNNNQPMNGFLHHNMGTQNYQQDRNIVKVDLDHSVETLTKSYYTEEEQERIDYEIKKKKLQQEYDEKQKKRHIEFNSKLADFEKGPIDAIKLFGLSENYTLEMLNKAYKKLALLTHPDRKGGSNEKFKTVTQSYMLLMERYKEKEQDRSYFDLKKDADKFFTKQKDNAERVGRMDKDRFDLNLFNKIYDDNRLYDPHDEGHGSWFQGEENTFEQPKIFSDKFNLNVFNSVFDQVKTEQTSTAIQKSNNGPNALISKSRTVGYTTLGVGDIDNFGKDTAKKDDLNYTDLKEAYTATHLINPNSGQYRKDFKNIEELKRDRAGISYTPDEIELRRQALEKIKEKTNEEKRVNRLRTYDQVVGEHYNKVHNKLLGFNPDLERQLTYD